MAAWWGTALWRFPVRMRLKTMRPGARPWQNWVNRRGPCYWAPAAQFSPRRPTKPVLICCVFVIGRRRVITAWPSNGGNMRLFLCEKPSQGRDIAAVLGATQRGQGFLHGPGVTVTWAVGHLLETAAPEAYGPQFGRPWTLGALPILPA